MARKLLLLGAAVVAAGVFLKRDKVAGLLPSRTEPYAPPATGPVQLRRARPGRQHRHAGPRARGRTSPRAIDEAAEEAAAAAEAANIGGTVERLRRPDRRARRPRRAPAGRGRRGRGRGPGAGRVRARARGASRRDGHVRRRAPDRGHDRAGGQPARRRDASSRRPRPPAGAAEPTPSEPSEPAEPDEPGRAGSVRRAAGRRRPHPPRSRAEKGEGGEGDRTGGRGPAGRSTPSHRLRWARAPSATEGSSSTGASATIGRGHEHARRDAAERPLPARRPDRRRRHVDGLSRVRPDARAAGRDQAHAPRDRVGLRPARALPARGARRRAALAPAHRRRDRRRRGRGPARTSSSSTSRARRSRSASAAWAGCRWTRRSPTRSRSPARSAAPTRTTSSTATSSPRTC